MSIMTNKKRKRAIIKAEEKLQRLLAECTHKIACGHCGKSKCVCGEGNSGSAQCSICHRYFHSWFCPESPDHLCDYFGIHDESNSAYEDQDDCIYCHQPDERK